MDIKSRVPKAFEKTETELLEDIKKEYRKAYRDIRKELALIESEGRFTFNELNKEMSRLDLEEFEELMSVYAKYGKRYAAEIEKMHSLMKYTHLEALGARIHLRLLELGEVEETKIDKFLSTVYEDGYYMTMYEAQKAVGLGFGFDVLPENAIREAITYGYSGEMFSDTLYENKDLMLREFKRTIRQGLIKGDSVQSMAKDFNKVMDGIYYRSEALVITESNFLMTESTLKAYEETGFIKRYRIIATLDNRVSKTCKDQDGKVYELKDRKVGVNYPPFHVRCRTTIAAVIEGKELKGTRIADNSYKVPKTMTYHKWRKYTDSLN